MARIMMILLLILSAQAAKLEISADSFIAQKNAQTGQFIGNVALHKGADYLYCAKLVLKSKAGSKISSYEAIDAKDFKISLKNKIYQGRAQKVIYDADKKMYFLSGNVQINEGKKTLKAEQINIDEANGNYELKGKEQAPVKFIFEVNE